MPDELSNGSSEIAALAQQVETARGKLPLQHDPALLQVLSEREIAAERELAEWIRAQRRKQRRTEIEAELAAEKRDRKSAAALRRSDDADARWHRRALAARRRVSSEDARLAQLYRRAEWSSRALIAVVVLGMVWAGVNVQHNLVPSGDMSDPLYWLSYGIEAMISIPIITIMVAATTAARWGRELARGKVIFFETALLGTTIALNAGPHLAAGDLGRAAEYAIAPVMVGVVIWLHAWVSARYAVLIDGAPVVERDQQMIRIAAERDSHASGLSAGGHYRLLDGGGDPADSGRFPWDRSDHTVTGGLAAEDGSVAMSQVDRPGEAEAGVRPTGNDHTVASPDMTPAAPTALAPPDASADGYSGTLAADDPLAISPADYSNPSTTNSHAVDTPTNGQAAGIRINGPLTNGHAVNLPTNGCTATPLADDHATVDGSPRTSTDGAARGVHETSTAREQAAGSSTNGRMVASHKGHPITSTNGHSVETSADRYAPDRPANAHFAAPSAMNVHAKMPTPHGHTAANGNPHDLPLNPGMASSSANGHTVPPAQNGNTAFSVAGYVFDLLSEEPTTRSADDLPAQTFSADTNRAPSGRVRTQSSAGRDDESVGIVHNAGKAVASEDRPNASPTSRQISIDEVQEELGIGERTAPATPGRENTASNRVSAQPISSVERHGRPTERARVDSDTMAHEGADTTESIHKSAVGPVAQPNANATAPSPAGPGKSLSVEQSDRSGAAEVEQLVLEEAAAPPRPRLRSEPTPIIEPEDDEETKIPAEVDEADTDDEISAIARAITGRRLSNLPVEEVREILTLADQGGTTPGIANELGVSRAAVTRVLDSAIKVHRPYAITG
ncbi:hypothetical protein OH799_28270 [Nocardia sp. NBC_00881]|uniref:hypothetical protein n=1 Tax=Nocardia sp. NBC_00881 TaxID=2975995 RepID=UPI003864B1FC|nr:hypothetical protein OH799_28270 [Nocardia sp. NBC_00881]